ncbi:MAG: hypothetical protein QOH50_5054 [Kribbellaceae bacterium]|nr:hypothetical protein [Kribbellaceae bacterium]
MNCILDYTRYVREKLEDKPIGLEETTGKFNTNLMVMGPGGLPLLPKPALGVRGHEIVEILKEVVREYFTIHYSGSCT